MGIKAVLNEPSILLLTMAFSFVKSVIYGLMLWVELCLFSFPYTSMKSDWPTTPPISQLLMTCPQSPARSCWGICSLKSPSRENC